MFGQECLTRFELVKGNAALACAVEVTVRTIFLEDWPRVRAKTRRGGKLRAQRARRECRQDKQDLPLHKLRLTSNIAELGPTERLIFAQGSRPGRVQDVVRRRRKETLTSSFRNNEPPYVVSYNIVDS